MFTPTTTDAINLLKYHLEPLKNIYNTVIDRTVIDRKGFFNGLIGYKEHNETKVLDLHIRYEVIYSEPKPGVSFVNTGLIWNDYGEDGLIFVKIVLFQRRQCYREWSTTKESIECYTRFKPSEILVDSAPIREFIDEVIKKGEPYKILAEKNF
jgi:hypothetical protein